MTREERLILSHNELMEVCKALMGIVLDNSLENLLDTKLPLVGVQPGFASRAEDLEKEFRFDRRRILAEN